MALDHLDNNSLITLENNVHELMVRMMVRAIGDPASVTGMANISFNILEGLLIEIQSERQTRGMSENKSCDDLLAYIAMEQKVGENHDGV